MIGEVYERGTGFKGVAAYLERGHRDDPKPDRVDWLDTRNLPTRDPQVAARIMAATARDSERTKLPVLHFSVSFDRDDPVTPDVLRRVADRTLRDMGLDEYQVIIISHRDRPHAHLHFLVNAVHPERHTAWPDAFSKRRLEASMREQEADLSGFRVVPGKLAPVPERARHRVERPPAPPLVRGDAAFLEWVKERAAPILTGARSWAELDSALAEHGLSIRRKGRGMIVTDGVREVKASEVDAAGSRHRLERRLGSLADHRERRPASQPAARLADRAPAVPPAQQPRRPRSHLEAGRDFWREVRALYADPRAARRAFLDAAERRGPHRAADTLRTRPQHFGALRSGADPDAAARTAQAGNEYARHRDRRLRPALQQAAQHLREAAQAPPREQFTHMREAAAVLAQIGREVEAGQLARRLAPMLPRSAERLSRQAIRMGLDLVRGVDPDRDRGLSI